MSDDHGGLDTGPLFIGLLGIMAGMVVVATYQFITSNCFKQRRRGLPDPERGPQRMAGRQHPRPAPVEESETPRLANGAVSTNPVGQTNGSATTFRYKNELGEGTCAVCICEFGEDEEIRVLPECVHSFHMECIDMWLFSHSSCPLCRTKTSLPPRHVADVLPVLH